jgi:glutathione transport system ATP-binding protein
MSDPILSIEGLTVEFGASRVVDNLSYSIEAGRTLAIVGESGSGKSVTALSIMRLADMAGARFAGGKILFQSSKGPVDLLALSQDQMRSIRGKEIAMIFQEPMTSLNPVFSIGDQISEALILHERLTGAQALDAAAELLAKVRLPDPKGQLKRYPHQLSGGMRQRVMIAMALACKPKLLIADEPTTALDVTIQAQILAILRDLQKEFGMGVIFITHDMGVVAEMADDVVVMRNGRKVEEGDVRTVFAKPVQPYTKALLAAVPKLGAMQGKDLPLRTPLTAVTDDGVTTAAEEERLQDTARYDAAPLLEVRDLVVRFDVKRGLFGGVSHRVHAVEKVGFTIYPGETLALVGESGSGKSTIGRTIQQLQAATSGTISFRGRQLTDLNKAERHALRQKIQYIFQDPFESLDPRKTAGFSIAEPILTHRLMSPGDARRKVHELLERVGLTAAHAGRYPHEFSGGQRQRVCIARALACDPELIVADESLSALDVSIQAQIINLMMDLQAERGLAYLFISHDMAVVEKISHRVAVLYLGQIVELGRRRQVFETPAHSYTKRLLSAVPVADPTVRRDTPVPTGEIPSPLRPVGDEPAIVTMSEIETGHFVAG